MPELRIALIMGGGVSLGSFSAGALARLVRLLEYVARGPARIDVVTGASAGSMTLAILLYHLYRGSPVEEIEAALRRSWVDRIDFDRLCPDLERHETPSLFSDAVVREIAAEALDFSRWGDGAANPYFAEGTLVSFALTNMNGVPVRAEGQLIRQPEAETGPATGPQSVFADAVQTTFHDDAIRFALYRDELPAGGAPAAARPLGPWRSEEARAGWGIFREAAIASGAFPAAFPPVRIRRNRPEFSIWPDELKADAFGFDYVDGGVLRNEPLREAIHLAAIRDEALDVERIFVLIDPNVSGTREVYSLPYNRLLRIATERDDAGAAKSMSVEEPGYAARLTGVLARLVGVLASQAAFRDWLRAAKVNSQIEWRDELAGILAELEVPAGSPLEERMDQLLEKIYAEKVMRSAAAGGPVDVARVRSRIAADLALRAEAAGAGATAKLHLLLDLVANLREKRKINLVAITPASTSDGRPLPIAGNFLSNFGGFFSEDYRAFDYAAGEFAASEVLTAPIGDARRPLRPEAPRLERPEPPPVDPDYRSLPPAVQRRLEGLVGDHVRRFAAGVGVPSILRGIVASKARSKVRQALIAGHPNASADFLVEIEGTAGLTLRGQGGSPSVQANPEGRVRTVVAVHRAGDGACTWIGPHVSTGGEMELVEKRFLRPSRKCAAVRLEGEPKDWLTRARLAAMPVLRVRLDGEPEVRRGVGELEDG